jgi:hypothetical protein
LRCSNGWTKAPVRCDGRPRRAVIATSLGSSRPLRGPRGRQLWLPDGLHSRFCDMLPKPDAAAPGRTRDSRIDQFDACVLESGNQFHQRIDVGPDDTVAGLHALNGRNGKVRQIGSLPLIDIQQRASSPELMGGNHRSRFSQSQPICIHRVNTSFKHQFTGVAYQARTVIVTKRRHGDKVMKLRVDHVSRRIARPAADGKPVSMPTCGRPRES